MVNNLKEPGKLLFINWNINLDNIPIEQLDHYIAVENYLLDEDDPPSDATNIDKVNCYLESFHHLCEVEDWSRAGKIIFLQIITPNTEVLGSYIGIWGYYHQQIELYSKMLGNLNVEWDIICWQEMGSAYQYLAEYRQAMKCSHKAIMIAREINDPLSESKALNNLGMGYYSLGDYSQAIEYHKQSLKISQKIGDLYSRSSEGRALNNLGNIEHSRGNYLKAIEYQQQSLLLAREVSNLSLEGIILGNLGISYHFLGD